MKLFTVLIGEIHEQRVFGIYSDFETACKYAQQAVESNDHEEASVLMTVLDDPPKLQWLAKRYAGAWLCSFYHEQPVVSYELPA